jgi:hypothetical protein
MSPGDYLAIHHLPDGRILTVIPLLGRRAWITEGYDFQTYGRS